ncbi:ABC transporter permease [Skermania piniformis]
MHLYLALLPLLVGLLLAVPIGIAIRRQRRLRRTTLAVASIAYTIPSLALLVILPPVLGISVLDPLVVVVALTVYSTALLVRAVPEALDSVPTTVTDAATAMGFGTMRRVLSVDLPLAIPVLITSIRVVAVTNISLVPIGSLIGVHGLGRLFTDGYQRDYLDEIVAGIIAVVALALLFDVLLYAAGRALTPWTRKELVGR